MEFFAVLMGVIVMSGSVSGEEMIATLKDLHIQTRLVEDGQPRAVVVAPDGEGYASAAEMVRDRIHDLTGVELPVVDPDDLTPEHITQFNIVLLGNAPDNAIVRRLVWERWLFDTWYPGDERFVVRSVHNPFGHGTNVIFLGGENPATVRAAADKFLAMLRPGDPLAVGWTMAFETDRRGKPLTREEIEAHTERADNALKFKNGRNLISGAAGMAGRYYATGQEGWAELFKVYMERHRAIGEPGMGTHMNVYDTVSRWDLIEESPVFSDAERLSITNHLLYILRSGEGCMHGFFRRGTEQPGVRHNHQTLPGLACLFGGRYFKLGYGLPEADEWLKAGKRLFDSQVVSHKPQCDCNCYEWGTMYQTGWWSLGSGDYTFFEDGACRAAADRAILEMDNRGYSSCNGDFWSLYYFPETLFRQAAEFYGDGRYEWALRKHPAGRRAPERRGVADVVRGLEPQEPTDLLGIRVAPMSPQFYGAHETTMPTEPPPNIPIERSFDKISFRRTFDAEDQYLLLDGIGRGSHGHVDVNGVSQFTDNGRIWLMDVSYAEAPNMRDHNVVTVLRNGETEDPPPLAALDGIADLEAFGFCRTSLPKYCGLDWHRNIFWCKERYFLFVDQLVALEPGDYTMRVHWRTPGAGRLDGLKFNVQQQEKRGDDGSDARIDAFALVCCGADRASLTLDTENVGKWFKQYEYTDPISSIVQQNRTLAMAPGDTHAFANAFFVSNAERPVDVDVRPVADGVVLVKDGDEIACLGVGPAAFRLGDAEVAVEAVQFVLAADRVAVHAATDVRWRGLLLASEDPASIEHRVDDHRAERTADLQKAWAEAGEWADAEAVRPAPESRGVRAVWTAEVGAPVLSVAQGHVDGRGEVAIGGADGSVRLLTGEGETLWTFGADGGINSVAIADIDGDGRGEVIAGSDDRCCYVLNADGTERWRYRGAAGDDPYWGRYWKAGEVEKVLAADIDGDGKREVVFAAANMNVHACDVRGNLLWKYTQYGVCTSLLAADLTGDGKQEVVGGPAKITCTSTCVVLNGAGEIVSQSGNDGWASALTAVCTADLDGDGQAEVICGTNMNNVYALDSAGGKLSRRWEYTAGDVILSLCAAPLSGGKAHHVIVGSASEFVYALDAAGRVAWRTHLRDAVGQVAARVCADGRVEIAAATSRALYILNEKGETMGAFPTDSRIVCFDLGERLLVGTEDGKVWELVTDE